MPFFFLHPPSHDDDERTLYKRFEEKAKLNFIDPRTRIVLNVGGLVVETSASVLCRDRFSLLAALCTEKPIMERDSTGAFFLDRDWWIFRYVLQFLRTGALPQDPGLLREMYEEASFYRLNSLRRAIEYRARLSSRPPHPSDPHALEGTARGDFTLRLGEDLGATVAPSARYAPGGMEIIGAGGFSPTRRSSVDDEWARTSRSPTRTGRRASRTRTGGLPDPYGFGSPNGGGTRR